MRYLIFILLFANINTTAQDLNETVDYINNVLKVNHSRFGGTSGIVGGPGPTFVFDRISVDSHGKIEDVVCTVDSITEKIISRGPPCNGYLKSINVIRGNDYITEDISWSCYRLTLFCATTSGKCFLCTDGTTDKIGFSVNNFDARGRLEKAFLHLLELAKNDKRFYEKDPFGN